MILILLPCFIIDAFLHQIHSATQKLKTMEARVAEIMEKQVFSTLDDISNFYLFDIDEAFARTWVRILINSWTCIWYSLKTKVVLWNLIILFSHFHACKYLSNV